MTTATARPTGTDATSDAWEGFRPGPWAERVDVRDFIQRNYTPYEGHDTFLAGPTPRTTVLWQTLAAMFPQERERGVYDIDAGTPSTIVSHGPGYIDKDNEIIVGLQTDAPLKRAIMSSSLVGTTHAEIGLWAALMQGWPAALASASKTRPVHAASRHTRSRIAALFSPMPAVNTSASSPPSAATSEPSSRPMR